MKDARFKELLNLHLDHRLSPEEAAELEAALRQDPARRRALRDYEAMQSACAALFARSASRAPSSEALRRALRQAEDRIDHPRTLRDAWGWPTWGLTGGLAACVALVVARLSQPAAGHSPQIASLEPAGESPTPVQVAVASTAVAAAATPATRRDVSMPRHITFAALGLNPSSANADSASRWILQMDEAGLYSTIEQATLAGEALVEWQRPIGGSQLPAGLSGTSQAGAQFSSRPINPWSQTGAWGGGAQVEAAGFRFER